MLKLHQHLVDDLIEPGRANVKNAYHDMHTRLLYASRTWTPNDCSGLVRTSRRWIPGQGLVNCALPWNMQCRCPKREVEHFRQARLRRKAVDNLALWHV
jgi:hypothetical protein